MSIIIRLQNLPWTAKAEDIRHFFRELVIPEGGVHIVGGEHGDAFIVFGSDEDARQAMMKDGGLIKEAKVKLLLSSRVEMQKVIDAARQQALNSQNLMQTLASAASAGRIEPSSLHQVPLLPNMLAALPALRTLAGMGALPTLATMPTTQTLPAMPPAANVAGLSTLPYSAPTPAPAPAPKVEPEKISQSPIINTDNRSREGRDGSRKNRSKSRSRSRSRSRDGKDYRDRYRYDDRSRDRKWHRDRSRSAERDDSSGRSRGRDANRRRSRSRDRRSRDRDRDYYRSKDKINDQDRSKLNDTRDTSPFRCDRNGLRTLEQNSRFGRETVDVPKSDTMKTPPVWLQNPVTDNKESRNEYSPQLPVMKTGASWYSGMMPSNTINPWILQSNDKLASASNAEPFKSVSPSMQPKPEIPKLSFGIFPFGRNVSQASSTVYPLGAYPAITRPDVPRELAKNFPGSTASGAVFRQFHSSEVSRRDSEERIRMADIRKRDSEELDDDVDCFGRQRRKYGKRSHSPERNNGEYYDKRDSYRPKNDYSYDYKAYGYHRDAHDEEDSRCSRNSQDENYRRSDYRRNYDRRDKVDDRRTNFRGRFNDESEDTSTVTGTCVGVRNLPKDASETLIKKFFSPLPLPTSSIKFEYYRKSNRIRTAFVKFATTDQKAQALKYDGKNMDEYRAQVFDVEDAQWETVEDENTDMRESYIKIGRIPMKARVEDIVEMFVDPPDGVAIKKIKGLETYTAFLKFKDAYPVQKALRNKHQFLICDSRVQLEQSYEADFLLAKTKEEEENQTKETPNMDAIEPVDRLAPEISNSKNNGIEINEDLPKTLSPTSKFESKKESLTKIDPRKEQVAKIESQNESVAKICPRNEPVARISSQKEPVAKIELHNEPIVKIDHRNETIAKIEPQNESEAKSKSKNESVAKVTYNKEPVAKSVTQNEPAAKVPTQNEYVAKSTTPQNEPVAKVASQNEPVAKNPLPNEPARKTTPQKETVTKSELQNKQISSRCVLLKNLPADVTDKGVLKFFADVKAFPNRIHIMFNCDGRQTGDVYCEFPDDTGVQNALQKNKCLFDKKSISVSVVPEEEVSKAVRPLSPPRYPPRLGAQPPFQQFGYRPRAPFAARPLLPGGPGGRVIDSSRPTLGVEDFGRPGCVVSLENVPYKADVEDIIDFFYGYDLRREDVIRRYNEKGWATGDARVCLRTPEEAEKACRELHCGRIADRTIYLRLVS